MRALITGAAVALLAAIPVLAGEGKCTHSTQECLDYMATQMKDSGWVGVEMEGSDKEKLGPMTLTKIVEGSPAAEAGLQVGDVLVAIGSIQMAEGNEEKLQQARAARKPGDQVTWSIRRGDEALDVGIKLGSMPADILARYIGQHMLEHASAEVVASK